MARYTGPRRRVTRRLGVVLPGLTRETPDDRPYPPGQHGTTRARRRRRESSYVRLLREKQKLRFHYGVSETQLRNYLRRASARPGRAGENLLQLLESRLDNVVYRLGLAPTIPAARQLVTHRHVTVDGRRVNFPGYEVASGELVEVRVASRRHPVVLAGVEQGPELRVPSYLERRADGLGGRVTGVPHREDVPIDVHETSVVEFYAR